MSIVRITVVPFFIFYVVQFLINIVELTFLIHVFYIIPQSHFVIENINIHTSITGMSILPWERSGDLWGRLINARLVQKFEYVMVRYQPIFVVVVFICEIECKRF